MAIHNEFVRRNAQAIRFGDLDDTISIDTATTTGITAKINFSLP
jgi:hypothetical protein